MLEGTEVLRPEHEHYWGLMLMRESEGPASFDSEKQNEPVNPVDCLFLAEAFLQAIREAAARGVPRAAAWRFF